MWRCRSRSDHATDRTQRYGFDQKLGKNVAAVGADCHSNADLPRALGYADEHDIHNANAAYEQRDGCDRDEQGAHDARSLRRRVGDFLLAANGKIFIFARVNPVALTEQGGDLLLDPWKRFPTFTLMPRASSGP